MGETSRSANPLRWSARSRWVACVDDDWLRLALRTQHATAVLRWVRMLGEPRVLLAGTVIEGAALACRRRPEPALILATSGALEMRRCSATAMLRVTSANDCEAVRRMIAPHRDTIGGCAPVACARVPTTPLGGVPRPLGDCRERVGPVHPAVTMTR